MQLSKVTRTCSEKMFTSAIKGPSQAALTSSDLGNAVHMNTRLSKFYRADSPTHPYIAYGIMLVDSAHRLLNTYNTLKGTGEDSITPERKILADWKKDREETKRLLRVGKRVAERKIRRLLKLDKNHTSEEERSNDDEADRDLAMTLFHSTESLVNGLPMGKTLEYAERGVRKILKGVPHDN
jgi:hypothetical protein